MLFVLKAQIVQIVDPATSTGQRSPSSIRTAAPTRPCCPRANSPRRMRRRSSRHVSQVNLPTPAPEPSYDEKDCLAATATLTLASSLAQRRPKCPIPVPHVRVPWDRPSPSWQRGLLESRPQLAKLEYGQHVPDAGRERVDGWSLARGRCHTMRAAVRPQRGTSSLTIWLWIPGCCVWLLSFAFESCSTFVSKPIEHKP